MKNRHLKSTSLVAISKTNLALISVLFILVASLGFMTNINSVNADTISESIALPANWDSLTSAEKRSLNPYNCADASQIRIDNGQCIQVPACRDSNGQLVKPDQCEFYTLLNTILNFMAFLVVPIISIMIIIGGVQYSAAQDNPESIKNARNRIYKAVIALICFIALWTFLQWLIPGGSLAR